MTEIQERLFELKDEKYRDFNASLIPTVDKSIVIGVRVPALRKLAKDLKGSAQAAQFMAALPHHYHEENLLQALLINEIKDFGGCMEALELFLPFVDNWAVCDMLGPKALAKDRERLMGAILLWLKSEHPYTQRFGICMLMSHFLDENFREEYLELVAGVRSEEYYVRMMQAWYFATALAKQYDSAVKYIEGRRLESWTHNKSIQKARESFRVSDEHKKYLKTLKI